jgi:hypothetical protein
MAYAHSELSIDTTSGAAPALSDAGALLDEPVPVDALALVAGPLEADPDAVAELLQAALTKTAARAVATMPAFTHRAIG